jgi:hypothetical protein
MIGAESRQALESIRKGVELFGASDSQQACDEFWREDWRIIHMEGHQRSFNQIYSFWCSK